MSGNLDVEAEELRKLVGALSISAEGDVSFNNSSSGQQQGGRGGGTLVDGVLVPFPQARDEAAGAAVAQGAQEQAEEEQAGPEQAGPEQAEQAPAPQAPSSPPPPPPVEVEVDPSSAVSVVSAPSSSTESRRRPTRAGDHAGRDTVPSSSAGVSSSSSSASSATAAAATAAAAARPRLQSVAGLIELQNQETGINESSRLFTEDSNGYNDNSNLYSSTGSVMFSSSGSITNLVSAGGGAGAAAGTLSSSAATTSSMLATPTARATTATNVDFMVEEEMEEAGAGGDDGVDDDDASESSQSNNNLYAFDDNDDVNEEVNDDVNPADGDAAAAAAAAAALDVDDDAERFYQLKVTFPDGAHTVISVEMGMTVEQLTGRLYSKAKQKLGSACPEVFRFRTPDSKDVLRNAATLSRVPAIRDRVRQQMTNKDAALPEVIFIAVGGPKDGAAAGGKSSAAPSASASSANPSAAGAGAGAAPSAAGAGGAAAAGGGGGAVGPSSSGAAPGSSSAAATAAPHSPSVAQSPLVRSSTVSARGRPAVAGGLGSPLGGLGSSGYLLGNQQPPAPVVSPEEQLFNEEIKSLIGNFNVSGPEVDAFRLSFAKLRERCVENRIRASQNVAPNCDCYVLPIPPGLPSNTKLRPRLIYPNTDASQVSNVTKTIEVTFGMAVHAVMALALEKASLPQPAAAYIFKVTGRAEYLHGNNEIIAYDAVRRCIKAGAPVELSIVERSKVEGLQEPLIFERPEISDALARGTEAPRRLTYAECSVKLRPQRELTHISIWDIQRKFRVRILGVDSIGDTKFLVKLRKRADATASSIFLHVTAALYHGGQLMAPPVQTAAVPFSTSPRWQQWLEFAIDVASIPQACRVCLTLWADAVKQPEGGGDQPADAKVQDEKKAADKKQVKASKGKSGGGGGGGGDDDDDDGDGDGGDDGDDDDKKASAKSKAIPLGWVNTQLIDHHGFLRSEPIALRLWCDKGQPANPIGTCIDNHAGTTSISFSFDKFARPVVFPVDDPPAPPGIPGAAAATEDSLFSKDDKKSKEKAGLIETLINWDPLYSLSEEEMDLLWECRWSLPQKPRSLPKFLQAVPWDDPAAVQEAHIILARWPPLAPLLALELLDAKYADPRVRAYAVRCLEKISDIDLADVILQLTQVLKYEAAHDSPLARFLMERALMNPPLIGHLLFWHLKSELHLIEIYERYGLMVEEYLRGCGTHRAELRLQNDYLVLFNACAEQIKVEPAETRLQVLRDGLGKIAFPRPFKLPLNPKMEVKDLIVPKCKFMDSKKRPLWLVFNNADENAAPILVIFKSGDDLRQDQLTLQMLRLMDKLWQQNDLDLRLKPYACVSTDNDQGMLEVVLNSETTAAITRAAGGATAAFSRTPIYNWLKSHNKTEAEMEKAVETFVLSCAGYCVATYVLGIGDRHNDNVMLTRVGNLFHIDFGHFLGNYKKKFGIKREKAPFVFTPDFAYVMGGVKSKWFKVFVETSCSAYNVLRRHSHLFINLFAMMLSTGIPELTCEDDILYLRNAFCVERNDIQAAKRFTKLIHQSLKTTTTQLNNMIHILAH
jgi:phosphatidylinositol 3-kinase